MIATHLDAKALGYCNAGLRRWFPRDGVTFDLFRQQGVSTDWLRATGDAMAIRLAEYVEQQAASVTNEGAKV
ncbi:hypothetical protein ACUHOQ_001274 [Pseudomonas aeruginosa]|uniref:hypothetical protein n=1 Tax=Pseudomonas aeruginosa TaxID=287 RepID=UPI000BB90FF9|nr:hypothetical protein [Pseudomonas aeruginosa]EKY1809577.1 hypothetical protein [Pseudomonas aeruginosa]MBI6969209.1 hypothetical protein [Pseudomonas aeruginosa]MBV5917957.1 hypothetical protein [Pseudomonas aeruginosa]MBX6224685.1 hypothetical protein [Pseudomonas aeruginosa]MCO2995745.1 hypothetical protein [Pseudomonas aeruginosa]